MIRKTGLVLVVVLPLLVVGWLYLARNAIVAGVASVALERMLGTEVQLEGVELEPATMRASFQRLRVASRERPGRWALVTGPARFDLDGMQLFARKLVVNELAVDGLGFDVPRPDYTPPAEPPGPTPADAPDGEPWTVDVPLPELDLSALERELDVERVVGEGPLAAEEALAGARSGAEDRLADLERRTDALDAGARVQAIQDRVQGLNLDTRDPRKLRDALKSLRAARDDVQALQDEVQTLSRGAQAEPGRVRADIAAAEAELDADVAAALRLVKLGGLNAEQVGALVFGPAVLERFNWVLARIRQARGMLGADAEPVREPPRRAGRWIAFPVTGRAYPGFLLEHVAFAGSGSDAADSPTLRFAGRLAGLSSNARVYGRPVRLEATAADAEGSAWIVTGQFDHRAPPGQDVVTVRGRGVRLGDLRLGGGTLPDRATARDAEVRLDLRLVGEALRAALRIDANQVRFAFAGAPTDSAAGRAVRELFAAIDRASVEATLSGTLSSPRLRVSSSIDEAFSRRMRAVLGTRRAEAAARTRRRLEQRIAGPREALLQDVQRRLAPLQARLDEAARRVDALRERLARRQAELKVR